MRCTTHACRHARCVNDVVLARTYARCRPMSTVGRFERSAPPTPSPEALSRNSTRVAVCRNNVRVMVANVREVSILVEVAHRVAAHKRKSMRVGQLIPQHFKADCRVLLTCLPQDVHHLTINSDRAIRRPRRALVITSHMLSLNFPASGLPFAMNADRVSLASSKTRSSDRRSCATSNDRADSPRTMAPRWAASLSTIPGLPACNPSLRNSATIWERALSLS